LNIVDGQIVSLATSRNTPTSYSPEFPIPAPLTNPTRRNYQARACGPAGWGLQMECAKSKGCPRERGKE